MTYVFPFFQAKHMVYQHLFWILACFSTIACGLFSKTKTHPSILKFRDFQLDPLCLIPTTLASALTIFLLPNPQLKPNHALLAV